MTNLIEAKNELFPLIQKAIELELSTIPPYLTALLSIKPGTNRIAANLIRSVMMEEMLHMVLAGNIMASLGGKVVFNDKHIPTYPLSLEFEGKKFRDREIDIDLAAFSQNSLKTFMRIELPIDWVSREDDLITLAAVELPGITIGDFYELIKGKITQLCQDFPESQVFCGNPAHQIDENYYWAGGGKPFAVTSLETAQKAIEIIVIQGEGSRCSLADGDEHYFEQPFEVAHFFRFREITFGRHYQVHDNPFDPPTGETFEVDYQQVFPILSNPKTSDYAQDAHMTELNDNFNRAYSLMLNQIAQAFNGSPEVLYTGIINGMNSLTPIAQKMMATTICGGDNEGQHGSPSFEWLEPY